MQRADAKYISGDMRDNFMFRAVLGKASKANYKMTVSYTHLDVYKRQSQQSQQVETVRDENSEDISENLSMLLDKLNRGEL